MPAGTKVAAVERKLKKRYGANNHAVFGTLNKAGLMHGNQPTAKGLQKKPITLTHTDRPGPKRTVLG